MKFNHPPAYGFGHAKKLENEKTDPLFNPGPGQYAPKKTSYHYPTWKIGTEPKTKKNKNDTPGPGQYTMPYTFQNGPKYSMSTKAGIYDPTKHAYTPGPGQYQPSSLNRPNSAKYTMRSKPYFKSKEPTPGPGNYNLRNERQLKVPSYIFGNEKKHDMSFPHSKFVPGPGNYNFNADLLHEKHPKFSFGKEIRGDELYPKTPGPGQYDYKHFIGKEAPKITMSPKYINGLKIGDNTFVPGPGQYNNINANNYRPKTPSYKIGTAQRKGLYNTLNVPGPGQYGPNNFFVRPKTPSWKIGTSQRKDLNNADKSVPGVGNYTVTKGIGNGPKYSMVGKGKVIKGWSGSPGPGQYNSVNAVFVKNPAWKIGTGTRDDEINKVKKAGVPGPGMYEFEDRTRVKSPHYRFGTEKRGKSATSGTPGPGQYHIPCAIVDVNDYTREQGLFDPAYRYI